MRSERATDRRPLILGGVTVLCVPLALIFLFVLFWAYPANNGYPVCDPTVQPWCRYDPTVRVRWFLGASSAAVAVLSLVMAYAVAQRIRLWWPWVLAPPVLLTAGTVSLGSIFGG